MSDGYDLLTALKKASSSTPRNCSGKVLRRLGKKCFQNAELRPTRFSHSRDCDSCTPGDAPAHSGVRSMSSPMPWLYIACPDSCIDPNRHSLKKPRVTRVVMRTSPGPKDVEKGWVEMSWRPRSRSYPSLVTTSSAYLTCAAGSKPR